MSAREPSEWAMDQALELDIYCDCGCRAWTTCRESMGFIAAALDAAEQRGFSRAVNETAIASIHKAAAAERAAIVVFLRVGAALDPSSPLAGYADAIERGDHHPKEGA